MADHWIRIFKDGGFVDFPYAVGPPGKTGGKIYLIDNVPESDIDAIMAMTDAQKDGMIRDLGAVEDDFLITGDGKAMLHVSAIAGTNYLTVLPKTPTGQQKIDGVYIKGARGEQGIQGAQGSPTTVNGKTGNSITLTAEDVGALPTTGGALTGGIQVAGGVGSGGFGPIGEPEQISFQGDNFYLGNPDYSKTIRVNGPTDFNGYSLTGLPAPNTATAAANKGYVDDQVGTKAPLASPVFTGTPKAPATSTSYTTYQIRNVALLATAPSSLGNGAIAMVYS